MVRLQDCLVQALTLAILVLRICLMAKVGYPASKNMHGSGPNDVSEQENARNCHNFSVGNHEKLEFYSPNYPGTYPNNTECILTITAPVNYVIRVDFLDKFHLEESPICEYDRLEIRNGLHGYSELLNKFCGSNFPNEVTSTDRYLWLKFSSDDSIEYTGFKGVYSYLKLDSSRPPSEECKFHRGGFAGVISNTDIEMSVTNYSTKWKTAIDCTWVLQVEEGYKIYLHFPDYKLGVPNNCDVNYIDIYGDSLTLDKQLAKFCGTGTEPQKSSGNILHIHYYLLPEKEALDSKFTLIYTALRESPECDPATEFNCEDGTCIEKSLRCNEQYNCKYRYDEDPAICTSASKAGVVLTSEHMIIILIVFFALVFGMCASITISCYAKIKERRDREREMKIRRSKEASVDIGLDRSVTSLDRGLEAALAAQAAEICARRKVPPGPGATTASSGGSRQQQQQHGGHFLSDDEEEDGGCYVPDMDMAVFRSKHPNGGPPSMNRAQPMVNTISDAKSSTTPSYHYFYDRRDSQDSGSQSPPLPPPPPPPPQHLRHRAAKEAEEGVTLCPHGNPLIPHPPESLPEEEEEDEEDDAVPSLPQRFRAEAVIEMNPQSGGGQSGQQGGGAANRARSFESTRSAPDVIVHR